MKPLGVTFALLVLVGISLPGSAAAQETDFSRKVAALVQAKESSLPVARAPDAARAALAHEVIEAGRVREMLSAAEMDAAFDDSGSGSAPVSPQLRNAIKVVAKASFKPERILAFLEPRLAETLDEATLSAGLQWERSDLGRRLTALQLRGSSDDQRAEFKAFIRDGRKVSDDRARACSVVDILSDSSNTLVPVFEAVATGGAFAIAAERSLPLDIETLARGMASTRPMLRDAARQTSLAICYFYYRDLSDAEFEQWLDFLRTENGGRYARGTSAAMRDAFLQRTEIFTRTLIEVARDLRKPQTTI